MCIEVVHGSFRYHFLVIWKVLQKSKEFISRQAQTNCTRLSISSSANCKNNWKVLLSTKDSSNQIILCGWGLKVFSHQGAAFQRKMLVLRCLYRVVRVARFFQPLPAINKNRSYLWGICAVQCARWAVMHVDLDFTVDKWSFFLSVWLTPQRKPWRIQLICLKKHVLIVFLTFLSGFSDNSSTEPETTKNISWATSPAR